MMEEKDQNMIVNEKEVISQETTKVQIEKKDEPKVEETNEAKVEEPIEAKAEDAVEVKAEEPVEPKAEEPVEPKAEEPIEVKAEEPIEVKAEDAVEPKAEEPIEVKAEESVEVKAEEPIEVKAEEPVEVKEEETIAMEDKEWPDELVEEKKKKQVEEQVELENEQDKLDEKAMEVHEDKHEDDDYHNLEEEDTTDYEALSLDELVNLMEDLVKAENITTIKNRVIKCNIAYQEKYKTFKKEHKENFLKEAEDKSTYKFDDGGLQERFNHNFKIYKQKRKELYEAQELLKIGNLARKNEILKDLKLLIESDESLKKIYDEFKNLQDTWRQIGMVPKMEAKNLWMNYNFLVDKFFEKVQIDRDLRDIGFKKNLQAKLELTEKVEELLLEKSMIKTFKSLQEYHRLWREIGPVPHDKSEEIWDRFKSATEKVNNRRREYYEKLEEDQKKNLALKVELCERAEIFSGMEYTSARDWNEKSKEFDALFDEWRKIGPAPKKQNDEIWDRFKSSMNGFYKNKKQYFGALKDEQMDNYNAKLDICKNAEAIMESTDWRNTTVELINLQKEWKKIGPVPRKYSDKVWKRFRTACDHFFNAKENYFKNIKETEKENLEQKKAIIQTIKTTIFSENKEEALNQMKDLQKQWFEIGQVPFRDKNNINRDFRAMVDSKLNEIGLSTVDVEIMRIKEKIGDDTKGNKEAKYIISKEMNSLKAKIDKIKSEINTWENNIGFFANSKNADVLKQEFQTKIDAANGRIKKMKSRINQLDKTQRSLNIEE